QSAKALVCQQGRLPFPLSPPKFRRILPQAVLKSFASGCKRLGDEPCGLIARCCPRLISAAGSYGHATPLTSPAMLWALGLRARGHLPPCIAGRLCSGEGNYVYVRGVSPEIHL